MVSFNIFKKKTEPAQPIPTPAPRPFPSELERFRVRPTEQEPFRPAMIKAERPEEKPVAPPTDIGTKLEVIIRKLEEMDRKITELDIRLRNKGI